MYNIISFDRVRDMKSKLLIVHPECADQFIASVLNWYCYQIEHPPKLFSTGMPEPEPPNVFSVIEYPDLSSNAVINLFHESDIHHMMDHYKYDYKTARDKSVEMHNNQPSDRDLFMTHDVEAILNGYHLFYLYQDDANIHANYHNPFVKEVW